VADKALVICESRHSSIRIVRIDEVIVCTLARERCRGLLNDQYIHRALDPLQGGGGEQHWVQNCKSTISKTKTVFF
jgi:hypothetical protein